MKNRRTYGIPTAIGIIAAIAAFIGMSFVANAQACKDSGLYWSAQEAQKHWLYKYVPDSCTVKTTFQSFFNRVTDGVGFVNYGFPFMINNQFKPSGLLGSVTGDSLTLHNGSSTFNPLVISSRLDLSNPMLPVMVNGLTNSSSTVRGNFIVNSKGLIITNFWNAALGLNLNDTLDFFANLASGHYKFPNFSGTIAVTNISAPSSADTARLHGGTNAHCYGVSSDTIMAKPNAWMTVKGSDGTTYKLPLYKQ